MITRAYVPQFTLERIKAFDRAAIRRALDALPFQVVATDRNGAIVYVSERFTTRYGHARAQLLGRPQAEIVRLEANSAKDRAGQFSGVCVSKGGGATKIEAHSVVVKMKLLSRQRAESISIWILWPSERDSSAVGELMASGWRELINRSISPAPALATFGSSSPFRPSLREVQIRTLDAMGCETKRIAHILGISDSTVRVIRARLKRKLRDEANAHAAS